MPHPTYYHLPDEKRRRVFEAAVDEFAEHRFSAASINRVVKAAGIPRGSFYQYFENKEDLYLHVLEEIGREKMEIFSRYRPPSADTGFFDTVLGSIPAIFEWLERCPRYARIGVLMALDGSDFIQRVIEKLGSFREIMLAFLAEDQRKGRIRPDVDLNLVADIYYAVAPTLLNDFGSLQAPEHFAARVKAVFDILANGIRCGNEGENHAEHGA